MPSGFILFFIGLAVGYMVGQTSVRDQLRKKGVSPAVYDNGNWIDKITNLVAGSKNNQDNNQDNNISKKFDNNEK